jgi:hypothetical protein
MAVCRRGATDGKPSETIQRKTYYSLQREHDRTLDDGPEVTVSLSLTLRV